SLGPRDGLDIAQHLLEAATQSVLAIRFLGCSIQGHVDRVDTGLDQLCNLLVRQSDGEVAGKGDRDVLRMSMLDDWNKILTEQRLTAKAQADSNDRAVDRIDDRFEFLEMQLHF